MKKIMKDQDYSKLLAEVGSKIPSDVDTNFEMKLPEWADHDKIKRAQQFFVFNLNANIRAIFIGLLQIIPEQTIFKILEFTQRSSTPQLAYKRNRITMLHGIIWANHELKPGTKAWESLEHVRKVHVSISNRTEKKGVGIISQKDMAITQFAFVGMQLLHPDKIGIQGTREQFELVSHNWRVLGHLLGIEDRFNVCGATLDETLARCEAIREDFLLPNFVKVDPKVEDHLRTAVEGIKGFEPWLHADTQLFTMRRFIGVQTCRYYENEFSAASGINEYAQLSYYTRFRVTLDVIIFEYLSKIWAFRWGFNIFRICFSVFDRFPIFAIMKFGRRNAYVEVMRTKMK